MANKVFKKKRTDTFIVATNATHALQLAECKRYEFANRYSDAGKTLAPPGHYGNAEALAFAESDVAKTVNQIINADTIRDARGS
jgi:hypothetical protein